MTLDPADPASRPGNRRTIVIAATACVLDGYRNEAQVFQIEPEGTTFTLVSDEPQSPTARVRRRRRSSTSRCLAF